MISGFGRRDHSRPAAGRRPRRTWLRLLLGAALAIAALLYLAFVLLPILARQGSLNQVVEGALQSVFSVPVTIESVETDPLSEFSITRVSSVSSSSGDRFRFRAARVTALYRPLDLVLESRLEELTVERPTLSLDLDEDLSGIVKVRPGSGGTFQVGRFRISDGRLEVRTGGRDLVFQDLDLDATGLGGGGDLSFRASVRGLGARLTAEGMVARLPGIPGDPPRFHIVSAKVDLEDLRLEPLVPFLTALGLEAAGGQLSLAGTAGGTWPDHVETKLSSRLSEAQLSASGGPHLAGGSGVLEIAADLYGALRKLEFQARLDSEARLVAGGDAPDGAESLERLSLRAIGAFSLGGAGEGGARLDIEGASLQVPGLGEATASGSVKFEAPEPSYSLDIHLPELTLERILDRIPIESLREPLRGARGTASLSVSASGTSKASQMDFEVARGSLSAPVLTVEAPEFTASGTVSSRRDDDTLSCSYALEILANELGWGPVVEHAAEQPIRSHGELILRRSVVSASLQLDAPSTGRVDVDGAWKPHQEGEPDLYLLLDANQLPTERFVKTWLSDPFKDKVRFLAGARINGRSSIKMRVQRLSSVVSVDGSFSASAEEVQLAGARIEGLDIELPFRFGGRASSAEEDAIPGVLRFARLTAGRFFLGNVDLPFQLVDRAYQLHGPASIPLLGGELRIEDLRYSPSSARERLKLKFTARELKTEELARVLGIREIPGRILFEVKSLAMVGDRVVVDGRLHLDVFGGSVELTDLSIDHPFSPCRSIRLASGRIHDFDLARLGETFRFGVASGVLDGRVSGLQLLGTEVVGYECEFETTPRSGVAQFLDKRAIESIQRIFSGPFGGIEDVFFSRFRYAGFGFTASVKNGGLRLRGKYEFGGTEYLMYSSWYQFPKVSIVNTHPGIVYDWDAIQDNLRSISQRPEGSK